MGLAPRPRRVADLEAAVLAWRERLAGAALAGTEELALELVRRDGERRRAHALDLDRRRTVVRRAGDAAGVTRIRVPAIVLGDAVGVGSGSSCPPPCTLGVSGAGEPGATGERRRALGGEVARRRAAVGHEQGERGDDDARAGPQPVPGPHDGDQRRDRGAERGAEELAGGRAPHRAADSVPQTEPTINRTIWIDGRPSGVGRAELAATAEGGIPVGAARSPS